MLKYNISAGLRGLKKINKCATKHVSSDMIWNLAKECCEGYAYGLWQKCVFF